MLGDQKRLLVLLLVSGLTFGAVVFGTLVGLGASAQGEAGGSRTARVVQAVRNADGYFARMSDHDIVTRAHVVCGLLRSGSTIEAVVGIQARTMPAAHVGVLLDSAVSSYCPDYRAALRDFIRRHS